MSDRYVATAAIDFGTSRTAVAFRMKIGREDDLSRNDLRLCSLGDNAVGGKVKTRLVLNNDDEKSFVAFGNNIINDFDEDEHALFSTFKMKLYRGIPDKIKADVGDMEIETAELFAKCLDYVSSDACNKMSELIGRHVNKDEVLWVLTVPAIWQPASKGLMREAAFKAGLIQAQNSPDLILGLEPECAAFACQEVTEHLLSDGKRYLILDCGGGTIDTAAFQVVRTANAIQMDGLSEPAGNNGGSEQVDANFQRLLRDILGDEADIIEDYDRMDIGFAFSQAKERYSGHGAAITIDNDDVVKGLRKKLPDYVKSHAFCEGTRFAGQTKLVISDKLMQHLLEPSVKAVEDHLDHLLKKIPNLDFVVLVGGFGNSALLRDRIQQTMKKAIKDGHQPQKLKFIHPNKPGLAVVQGGVYFGDNFGAIRSRILDSAYGIQVIYPEEEFKSTFPNTNLSEVQKFRKRNPHTKEVHYQRVFYPLVHKGEQVKVNHPKVETLPPERDDQEYASVIVFRKKEPIPDGKAVFVDECQKLGTIEKIAIHGKEVTIKFEFASTEFSVSVANHKGEVVQESLRISFAVSHESSSDVPSISPDQIEYLDERLRPGPRPEKHQRNLKDYPDLKKFAIMAVDSDEED